jgi:hypothetical protein
MVSVAHITLETKYHMCDKYVAQLIIMLGDKNEVIPVEV